jgi:hypothetical protein
LIAALNSVGGWPITGNVSRFKGSSYDWRDSLAKIIGQLGLSFIYSISVEPDSSDTLVNRVYVRIYNISLLNSKLYRIWLIVK